MSRQLIPQEMKGYFIDDKTSNLSNLYFQWKVDLTYIKSNSDGGFPAGFNSMEVRRN